MRILKKYKSQVKKTCLGGDCNPLGPFFYVHLRLHDIKIYQPSILSFDMVSGLEQEWIQEVLNGMGLRFPRGNRVWSKRRIVSL